jgi:predicted outer membrane protein
MSLNAALARAFMAATVVFAGCSNSKAGDAETGSVAAVDRTFAEQALAFGRRAVEHGRIAEARAASGAVKQYASRVVAAHEAANQSLLAVMERKHIELEGMDSSPQHDRRGSIAAKNDAIAATKRGGRSSGAPSATGTTGASGTVATTGEAIAREQAGTSEPWIHISGLAFDDGFLASQLTSHANAIALFDQQLKTGVDPELKAFAQQQLPSLREHWREGQQLQHSMQTPR